MIYWFTGASTQAVTTGAYRAVEFIKANINLASAEKASVADSKKVVEICTKYAQKGMLNIFIAVFFATLAFAFVEPFFFIGYLISIAIFGLYQAIFMADAGAAWDNAKKIVEVELKQKGTPLHDATVIGDTVGDPFKDTSSGDQIHHAVRLAGGGVGREADTRNRRHVDACFGGCVLPGFFLFRLPVVLRHAH
jgi:K(+)-stimulated pyrophosphate-energized sodium pump